MKKEMIFLGPPASGKGTQTNKLSEYLHFPHIDTGSLLRNEIKNKTEDGEIADKFIKNGQLVPPELVGKIIKNRLSNDDCKQGYVLDGYPRSLEQALMLEKINEEIDTEPVDFIAVYFDIDTESLIQRIIHRRSCPVCGKIYNDLHNPPQKENTCDVCNVELVKRSDDTEEIARKRFETYYNETHPLIDFYAQKGKLKKIDANGDIQTVWERLLKVIND